MNGNVLPEKEKKRITWVDTAKGIGVFLVVLGHLWYRSPHEIINQMIYSFHMPMFFVLSGFLFDINNKTKSEFIKRKAFNLLVPATLFVIMTIPLYIYQTGGGKAFSVSKFFYIDGLVAFNDPCWFFFALFEVFVIVSLLGLQKKSTYRVCIIGIAFFLVGAALYYYDISLLFGLDKAIIAAGFFAFGKLFREIESKTMTRSSCILVSLINIVLWVLFGVVLNEKISFYKMELGNYAFFVLSGIFGSAAFLMFAKRFDKLLFFSKSFRWLGQNSVIIIGTHYILLFYAERISGFLGISYTWKFDIYALAVAIGILLCYYPLCLFVNKYLPWLNGKKRVR